MAEVAHHLEEAAGGARLTKRRWGYVVWGIAAVVIGTPEIIAAKWSHWLPFTTISTMTGHLERHHNWVELIVVAILVLFVFSLARVRPQYRASEDETGGATTGSRDAAAPFDRTAGGRLTAAAPKDTSPARYDAELAPTLFTIAAALSLSAVVVGTWAATQWWDDTRHFQPAYVLYGSLGLLWIVIPSFVAVVFERDVPFPTLFRTVGNLEDWLRQRTWPWSLGPKVAWLVAYVIFAGLVILLLHLTLYPYPDITHILNPGG